MAKTIDPDLAARLREESEQTKDEPYPKDVKVVWRHMPLPFHADAPLASEAAQEAFVQGGNKAFWKFHEKLSNEV